MTNNSEPLTLKISRNSDCVDLPLPGYMSAGAAGFDVHAAVTAPITLEPGGRALIPTGLHFEIPPGYEAQTRPRSGLAVKHGITIVNAPGTIDSDYRGEVKIILANLSDEPFIVERSMRIAQVVIAPVTQVKILEVEQLTPTDRGAGGFGHTGT